MELLGEVERPVERLVTPSLLRPPRTLPTASSEHLPTGSTMEDPLVNPLEDLVPEEAEGDDARELQHGRRGDKQEATLRGGSTREVDVADGGAKAEEPSGKGLTSQAEEEVGERAAPCQERDPASPASQVSRLTEQMSRAVSGAPVPSLPTDSSTNNSSTSSPPPRSRWGHLSPLFPLRSPPVRAPSEACLSQYPKEPMGSSSSSRYCCTERCCSSGSRWHQSPCNQHADLLQCVPYSPSVCLFLPIDTCIFCV